jgi:hypothetical protein
LPQPKDNSTYLEKEKERRAALSQENAVKQKQQEEYWAAKGEFAMSLKDKLVGIEMPNIGVSVTKEMVDNAYIKLEKSWGSPRYFDDKGDYRPELERTHNFLTRGVKRQSKTTTREAKRYHRSSPSEHSRHRVRCQPNAGESKNRGNLWQQPYTNARET